MRTFILCTRYFDIIISNIWWSWFENIYLLWTSKNCVLAWVLHKKTIIDLFKCQLW